MAYLSRTNAKIYLGIASADTSDDTLIDQLLLAGQAAIDGHCGRTFEAATATRYYDADAVQGQDLLLDVDLLTITTLTNGDGEVLSSAYYTLWPRNSTPYARIRLKSTKYWNFLDADSEISVAGTWAYSTTAPEIVIQAMRDYVHFFYHSPDARQKNLQGAQRADVLPQFIADLLGSVVKSW